MTYLKEAQAMTHENVAMLANSRNKKTDEVNEMQPYNNVENLWTISETYKLRSWEDYTKLYIVYNFNGARNSFEGYNNYSYCNEVFSTTNEQEAIEKYHSM